MFDLLSQPGINLSVYFFFMFTVALLIGLSGNDSNVLQRMNEKQTALHPCKGILLNDRKEGNAIKCNTLDEPQSGHSE